MPTLVLASQSASRRRLLESAGLKPTILVSNVDEETDFFNSMTPEDMVIALAITKAHTVREQIDYPAIIIGCDSTFEFEGQSLGKPGTAHVAKERAQRVRGKSGYLHTGHCVIDTQQEREISDRITTKVTFTDMSDDEIDDYIESGEPLHVAGGFTLDGFSSPFIP
jgi:septum formation protein